MHCPTSGNSSKPAGGWRDAVALRRTARAAATPLDTRSVLYEAVLEFLVDQCARAATADESGDPRDPRSLAHHATDRSPRPVAA